MSLINSENTTLPFKIYATRYAATYMNNKNYRYAKTILPFLNKLAENDNLDPTIKMEAKHFIDLFHANSKTHKTH